MFKPVVLGPIPMKQSRSTEPEDLFAARPCSSIDRTSQLLANSPRSLPPSPKVNLWKITFQSYHHHHHLDETRQ